MHRRSRRVCASGWIRGFIRLRSIRSIRQRVRSPTRSDSERSARPFAPSSERSHGAVHGRREVPVSIIYRDDIALDGSHPTLFEGYGSYGDAIDPAFSASSLEWVLRGGVLATAHVRGGGEYGERWHLAGQKATKQHTIDDMIATARYLIAQKYTSPSPSRGSRNQRRRNRRRRRNRAGVPSCSAPQSITSA